MGNLAVFVSGTGEVFKAIHESGLHVYLVLADRPCRAIEIAQELRIHTRIIERADLKAGSDAFNRKEYTQEIVRVLQAYDINLVAMAGFMTVLDPVMFEHFAGRVLNTHPSLLPAFKGQYAVEQALKYGVKITGCTVHIATEEVDSGTILAQAAVPVLENDTAPILHERIKTEERRAYPEVIKEFIGTIN